MVTRPFRAAFGLVAFLFSALAQATPVFWTLENVAFVDAVVTGSFSYHASTNTYDDIMVSSGGVDYNFLNPDLTSSAGMLSLVTVEMPAVNTPRLDLTFDPALSDAGGVVNVSGIRGLCSTLDMDDDTTCERISIDTMEDFMTQEGGTATGVPAPATLPLFLLGAGMMAWRRRVQA